MRWVGHPGIVINVSQARVIKEPECCDGSDEPLGVCPNKCREIGEAYAHKMEAERKLRKTVCCTASLICAC